MPGGMAVEPLDPPLVLVVEDDLETRQFYTTALSLAGFRVDQAHNGFQALEKVMERCPDAILTDIAVPGLDGIELCRRLRRDVRTESLPVLAITGYGDRQYVDRVVQAGANAALVKPCGPDQLVSELRRLLDSRRVPAELPIVLPRSER